MPPRADSRVGELGQTDTVGTTAMTLCLVPAARPAAARGTADEPRRRGGGRGPSGSAQPCAAARERKLRSRRLLATTNTELNAMAAPAIMGLSRPIAARGRAATL